MVSTSSYLIGSRKINEMPHDELEKRLAQGPVIAVPTTLEGDANGAPHPDASAYAKKCSGKYAHQGITGGIGHNLPQEAPQAFAEAVLEVDGYGSALTHDTHARAVAATFVTNRSSHDDDNANGADK